jgi:transcriptional regulator with XRE-family HTH domain
VPRTAASDLASKLVGREVRRARLTAGLTQAEVAERLGTSASYVANVEAGRLNPTVGQLARIAEAVGADFEVSLPRLEIEPVVVDEPA